MKSILGNRLDWWEPSDDEEFTNRTECLMDQYSNFNIRHRGREYSLGRTPEQGENIADNGAVKVAYRLVKISVIFCIIFSLNIDIKLSYI